MVALPATLVVESGDRFHSHIFDVLVFCSLLWKAADSTELSSVPAGSVGKVECEHLPYELLLDAHGPAELALRGEMPNRFVLHVRPRRKGDHPFRTEGTASVTVRIFSAVFALACEEPLNWQKGITSDASKWLPTLAFCRVVRNAIAHNGLVHIANARAPLVTWRGLSYGTSDNGRAIIGADLGVGDLLILLFDLDEELTSADAPRVST